MMNVAFFCSYRSTIASTLMTSLQLLLSSAALFLLLPSSSLADDTHCHIDVAIDNGYTTFVSAAISSGYVTELAGIDETLTTFAPTNEAFDTLPAGAFDYLISDKEQLASVLGFHTVKGNFSSSDLTDELRLRTITNERIMITGTTNTDQTTSIMVEDATITQPDLYATDGVVHGIDKVLIPPGIELPNNIIEQAMEESDLTTFILAVIETGLTDELIADIYTVFAPTDEAFDDLPAGALAYLLGDTKALMDILLYHVASGTYMSTDLTDGLNIPVLDGNRLTVGVDLLALETANETFNGAMVEEGDILCLNGVIQKIDKVLFPPSFSFPNNILETLGADTAERFTTLVSAIEAAGLADALAGSTFTMFAPTDEAFAALPGGGLQYLLENVDLLTDILLHHLLEGFKPSSQFQNSDDIDTLEGDEVTIDIDGETITVSGANILETNITALNGIIHAIDEVLLPPGFEFPQNLADVAAEEDDLTILVAAAAAVFPHDIMNSILTVFAPIDDAFEALPVGALDHLLGNPTDLAAILSYHVVPGIALSSDLSDGTMIMALDNNNLTATNNITGIFIGGAAVLEVDILALNGIIHKIDDLLYPPGFSLPTNIVETLEDFEIFSTLVEAVAVAGMDEALVTNILTVFAPTNRAFEALPGGGLEHLLSHPDSLAEVLMYHAIEGSRLAETFQDGDEIETVVGEDLSIRVANGTLTVNAAAIVEDDILALNGVIHATDQVILPPGFEFPPDLSDVIAEEDDLTIFFAAAEAVGDLSSSIWTIFAPTDAAFEALPAGALDFLLGDLTELGNILAHHVAPGVNLLSAGVANGTRITTIGGNVLTIGIDESEISVNEAAVLEANILSLNGVLHKIDTILLPPDFILPSDIVDVLVADGRFDILVAAIVNAGLSETLVTYLFTVFAPIDEAFAALPGGALEYLLFNPEMLTEVILYHVIAGSRLAVSFQNGEQVETISGDDVIMQVTNETVTVNEVLVIEADILILNGVIHAIEEVLLPPGLDFPPNLVEVASSDDDLSFFFYAATIALPGDLENLIITAFAPVDAAFQSLPAGALDYLLTAPHDLATILQYHITPGVILSTGLIDGIEIVAIDDNALAVVTNETGTYINDAMVFDDDIVALNGVIHKVDSVLIPPGYTLPNNIVETLVADGRFDTLVDAVVVTGLAGALTAEILTIFAPTDDAFAALTGGRLDYLLKNPDILTGVLLYHVVAGSISYSDLIDTEEIDTLIGQVMIQVDGESISVDDATIVEANIAALNGIIHSIDEVLLPSDIAFPPGVFDIVESTDELSTLKSLLTATGLDVALEGAGPLTLFAPTNEAFSRLPVETLDLLLAEEGLVTLTGILNYHVLSEVITSSDIALGLPMASTLQGESVEFSPPAIVNTATITEADLEALNGIVHVIDDVLVPS